MQVRATKKSQLQAPGTARRAARAAAMAGAFCGLSGVAGGALAQGAVSLYGVVDSYLEYARDGGGPGAGGTGHRVTVQSGGLSGSRWGLKGAEDLGGGLKAKFQLESGIQLDSGASSQGGRLFGRQSWVGLAGNFGEVVVGRQYSQLFLLAANTDPMDTAYGSSFTSGVLSLGQGGSGVRIDNAVSYYTPIWSGLQGSLLYGFAEQQGSARGVASAGLTYAQGPLYLGGVYLRDKTRTTARTDLEDALVAGTYKVGAFKLMGGYSHLKIEPVAAAERKRNEFYVGSMIDVLPAGLVEVAYGQGKTTDADDKAQVFSLGYVHSLSARTQLYAIGSKVRNRGASAFAPSGADSANDLASRPGSRPSGLALGMRHIF